MKILGIGLVLALLLLTVPQAMALKYGIDGNLSDWGITDDDIRRGLNDTAHDPVQVGDENAWVPDVSTVKWIIEDNVDPDIPGYGTYYGVHIMGNGSTYSAYNEPLATTRDGTKVAQPYGGEPYDVEALYIDEDAEYVYVAIIASVTTDASIEVWSGDLAINADSNLSTGEYGYEYGVKIPEGTVWRVTDWTSGELLNVPVSIADGTQTGNATVAMRGLQIYERFGGNNTTNFILEVAIPRSALGYPPPVSIVNYSIHYTITRLCGNDPTPSIPEFLLILIPAGLIIGAAHLRKLK